MNIHNLTVGDRMTPTPNLIEAEQTLNAAHALMHTHGIRHLPVVNREGLVGILSIGDLHYAETLRSVDRAETRVEDVMSTDIYAVPPGTALRDVANAMAARKIGCAVVVEESRVVGMFTTVDALDTLALVLAQAT
jgi:acetoin utilization protein AcuB